MELPSYNYFYRLLITPLNGARITWVFEPNLDLKKLLDPDAFGYFAYAFRKKISDIVLEKVFITESGSFEFETIEIVPTWTQLIAQYRANRTNLFREADEDE